MNKDLERLIELVGNRFGHEEDKQEYEQLKSKLNEKLEKADLIDKEFKCVNSSSDYPITVIRSLEQQIKQLEEELEGWKSGYDATEKELIKRNEEIQSQLEESQYLMKLFRDIYPTIGKEYWKQVLERMKLWDSLAWLGKIEEAQKRIWKYPELESQNEKLQKVIEKIKKKVNSFKQSFDFNDGGVFQTELKSILSEARWLERKTL